MALDINKIKQNPYWDHIDPLKEIIKRNENCICDINYNGNKNSSEFSELVGCIYIDERSKNNISYFTQLTINDCGWIYESDTCGLVFGQKMNTLDAMEIIERKLKK